MAQQRLWALATAMVLVALTATEVAAQANRSASSGSESTIAEGVATEEASPSGVPRFASEVRIGYGKLPLTFEPNLGQTNERVQFLARAAGYALFLASSEATFVLAEPRQPDRDR